MRDRMHVFVTLIVIALLIGAAVGVVELLGLRVRWEAQLEANRTTRVLAQTELVRQRQQGLLMAPGVIASLIDTLTATAATALGWITALLLAIVLFADRRRA